MEVEEVHAFLTGKPVSVGHVRTHLSSQHSGGRSRQGYVVTLPKKKGNLTNPHTGEETQSARITKTLSSTVVGKPPYRTSRRLVRRCKCFLCKPGRASRACQEPGDPHKGGRTADDTACSASVHVHAGWCSLSLTYTHSHNDTLIRLYMDNRGHTSNPST